MNIVKKILKSFFIIILIMISLYSAIIIFQKIIWKETAPNFLGYEDFIVITGSMAPTLNIGDVVFTKETTDIKKQDIIAFKVEDSVVTHRVIEIKKEDNKNFYITKGDANSGIDSELIKEEDIEGKYIFKIPFIGNIILFFQKPIGLIIVFSIFVGILLLGLIKKPKHMKKGDDYGKHKKN